MSHASWEPRRLRVEERHVEQAARTSRRPRSSRGTHVHNGGTASSSRRSPAAAACTRRVARGSREDARAAAKLSGGSPFNWTCWRRHLTSMRRCLSEPTGSISSPSTQLKEVSQCRQRARPPGARLSTTAPHDGQRRQCSARASLRQPGVIVASQGEGTESASENSGASPLGLEGASPLRGLRGPSSSRLSAGLRSAARSEASRHARSALSATIKRALRALRHFSSTGDECSGGHVYDSVRKVSLAGSPMC
mmetsp:Transcript_36421/g.62548  ORF Transcript_36421/g.62548 Transcript_36421/m.62548 type:complete len:251 (+) Transcript_36421:345-1097(+)